MNRIFLLAILVIFCQRLMAQPVRLEDCISKAIAHQQFLSQQEGIQQQGALQEAIIKKEWLPQLALQGSAALQNEQITFPSAPNGMAFPEVPLYNVRALLSVSQPIYDAGMVALKLKMKQQEHQQDSLSLSANQLQVRQQVTAMYFGLLLNQQQQGILEGHLKSLQARVKQAKAAAEGGAMANAAVMQLQARVLELQQQLLEASSGIEATIEQLSLSTGEAYTSATVFELPEVQADLADVSVLRRPEMQLLSGQKYALGLKRNMERNKLRPQIGAFASAGVGNPGYNIIEAGWSPMASIGLSVNWVFFDWGKSRKTRDVIQLQQAAVDYQQERLKLNLQLQLTSLRNDILKNEAMLESDQQIVALRRQVLSRAEVQVTEGVMTTADYLRVVQESQEAEFKMAIHQIQVQMQKLNFNLVKGL